MENCRNVMSQDSVLRPTAKDTGNQCNGGKKPWKFMYIHFKTTRVNMPLTYLVHPSACP